LNFLVNRTDAISDSLATALRKRRGWVVSSMVAFGLLFAAVAFLSRPVYRAQTIVAPANVGREARGGLIEQLSGIASLMDLNLDTRGSATEEALAVLTSRNFLESFIADYKLLPRFFPNSWKGDEPTPARGVKYFTKNILSVTKDKKTGLITVIVDWTDREEAASWANDLVARINAEMRSRAIATSQAYMNYLEKAREATAVVETREAISRLIEWQIKQGMVATVTKEYAFRIVDQALPPDADEFVRPRRALLLLIGPLVGLLVACLVIALATRAPSPTDKARWAAPPEDDRTQR
jgi:uncharacterized protein involved in exopolysaccharide biosynthesis